jgi:hypothetical protein
MSRNEFMNECFNCDTNQVLMCETIKEICTRMKYSADRLCDRVKAKYEGTGGLPITAGIDIDVLVEGVVALYAYLDLTNDDVTEVLKREIKTHNHWL